MKVFQTELLDVPPDWLPPSNARGSRAKGLTYERAVAKRLPQAQHGRWFWYRSTSGVGWCQPDFLIFGDDRIIVIETKLKNWKEADTKFAQLYLPVLLHYFRRPVLGVTVVRHLSPDVDMDRIFLSLAGALRAQRAGGVCPIVHWMGRGPL